MNHLTSDTRAKLQSISTAIVVAVLGVLRETEGLGHVQVLSFKHVDLARIREKAPELRAEAIGAAPTGAYSSTAPS